MTKLKRAQTKLISYIIEFIDNPDKPKISAIYSGRYYSEDIPWSQCEYEDATRLSLKDVRRISRMLKGLGFSNAWRKIYE